MRVAQERLVLRLLNAADTRTRGQIKSATGRKGMAANTPASSITAGGKTNGGKAKTMSDTPETSQLEECDQYKVDEDYAEYSAYRRMAEHARTLEGERNTARVVATDALRELDRILDTGDTYATREIVQNLKTSYAGILSENSVYSYGLRPAISSVATTGNSQKSL